MSRILRAHGLPAASGNLVSTPEIMEKARAKGILGSLANVVLDLETAALARLAAREGLPFLALRAISDEAHQEIPPVIRKWAAEEPSPGLGRLAAALLLHPYFWPECLRLWRQSSRAARNLARALQIVLSRI